MNPEPSSPQDSSEHGEWALHEQGGAFRRFAGREEGRRRGGRKALQLCRQVQKALGYALSECHDEALQDLYVSSVEPAPNDKRLLVSVTTMGDPHPAADILRRLHQAMPFLRSEVAASIHRRRVPELLFQYLPLSAAESPPPDFPADQS